jgi:2-polyprenyl-6-methoxyphenol hydroxylase-like FAD-dependent oxidoreductase
MINKKYIIKSKYLLGADGANSRIAKQLGIPFSGTPGLSLAINVMVHVDLSDHVAHRIGNLHWIMQPEAPEWGWLVIMRMVKPWSEWIMILFQKPGWKPPHEGWLPSKELYEKRVKDLIGDDSIPFKVTGVSKWLVNEVYADEYQRGRIICGGDAVHRHPPINGLGSNTCIQDSHNLCWKLSYVLKGKFSH